MSFNGIQSKLMTHKLMKICIYKCIFISLSEFYLINSSTSDEGADTPNVCSLTAAAHKCPPTEGKKMGMLHLEELEGEEESNIKGVNIREEVNSITALLDALLPVLHEVTQGEQDIIAHRDLVFRRPGFHSYQDDACVQLLLVDLLETTLRCRNNKFSINHSIADYWNSITHSIGHVHH